MTKTKNQSQLPGSPSILTTTVGSYSPIDWLAALPSDQTLMDAIRVVVGTQEKAGIDLPTDGELYRFDPNHPDTNGMIEYFISRMEGINTKIGINDSISFSRKETMKFRNKPAGVVNGPLTGGALNLLDDYERSASVTNGPLKFTITSPFMLARTLLDNYYNDFSALTLAVADVLAEQVAYVEEASCIQVDEANIPGNPEFAPLASQAINRVLAQIKGEKAVHFCFGNYGGQAIQTGSWRKLLDFLNSLECDHLVLELAHRPDEDLQALAEIDNKIKLGLGVVDIKVNHVESADEIARRIDKAAKVLGEERIGWVHPDCGFWMLKRSIAERKLDALVSGRDKFIGA